MSFQRCPATEGLPERWVFEERGVQATVVPSAGMNLTSLEVDGIPFLHLPSSLGDFMRHVQTGGVPLLHPWANRLRGDRYRAGDVEVDLAGFEGLKRDEHHLPIHGLVLRSPDFRVEIEDDRSLLGSLDWGPGTWGFEAFPFPHTLKVRWVVEPSASSVRATCTMMVTSEEGRVPVGSGWHPYVAPAGVDGSPALELVTPPLQRVELDDLGLPVRRDGDLSILGVEEFDGPLGKTAHDDLFLAPPGGWEAVVRRGELQLRIEADEHWPMLQVYAPVDAGYVCVEPMLAPTAALSDGVAPMVEAGGTFSASFSLQVGSGGS